MHLFCRIYPFSLFARKKQLPSFYHRINHRAIKTYAGLLMAEMLYICIYFNHVFATVLGFSFHRPDFGAEGSSKARA